MITPTFIGTKMTSWMESSLNTSREKMTVRRFIMITVILVNGREMTFRINMVEIDVH